MATNPFLELAGSPGATTSGFAQGNFGSQPGDRPAGQPKLPAPVAQRIAMAHIAAALAALKAGSSSKADLFLP
jgi:hypothetical protein